MAGRAGGRGRSWPLPSEMATFLLKTEPGDYSWDDLVRDKKTVWDGGFSPVP